MESQRDHGRFPSLLDDVERDERFLTPGECFADDEIDPGVDRPAYLLLEHGPYGPFRGIVAAEDVGVADVAGKERAALRRDLFGDGKCLAVHCFEQVLLTNQPKLFTMRVVGEGLDHIRSGM